jgi:hypothetical protein
MAIAALVLLGNLRAIWSFRAFTVFVYYAVTNLAALRLPAGERRYPRVIAAIGLAGCLFLASWVERVVWASGLAITGVGLIWHAVDRVLTSGHFVQRFEAPRTPAEGSPRESRGDTGETSGIEVRVCYFCRG